MMENRENYVMTKLSDFWYLYEYKMLISFQSITTGSVDSKLPNRPVYVFPNPTLTNLLLSHLSTEENSYNIYTWLLEKGLSWNKHYTPCLRHSHPFFKSCIFHCAGLASFQLHDFLSNMRVYNNYGNKEKPKQPSFCHFASEDIPLWKKWWTDYKGSKCQSLILQILSAKTTKIYDHRKNCSMHIYMLGKQRRNINE